MALLSIKNAYGTPFCDDGCANSTARYPKAPLQLLKHLPLVALHGLVMWQDRARQRHKLSGLDDRLLRDMGLSRADVENERTKPFWRA